MVKKHQGQWRSRVGFLLACTGVCTGYGVISEYPGRMARNGGYRFMLLYLALVALCALSVLPAVEAISRRWRCSMASAPGKIKKEFLPVGLVYFVSAMFAGGGAIAYACYGLRYFLGFAEEIGGGYGFKGVRIGEIVYQGITEQTETLVKLAVVITVISIVIAVFDVCNGIEFFARLSIPTVMSLLILLTVYGFSVLHMNIQNDGMHFLQLFMMANGSEWSFVHALKEAGAQIAEGLLVGLGIVSLYASKTPTKAKSARDVWIIAFLPVVIALLAASAVCPMLQASGVEPESGGQFLFYEMFDVFAGMGTAGNLLGAMFYLAFVILCVFISISCMKMTAETVQEFYWMKKEGNLQWIWMLLTGAVMFGIGVLLMMSTDGLSGNLMRCIRLITEGVLAPLGGIVACILAGWYMDQETREIAMESGVCKWHMKRVSEYLMKYIMPIVLAALMISEIATYFAK